MTYDIAQLIYLVETLAHGNQRKIGQALILSEACVLVWDT
jgi:hypothetical protein